MGRLIDQTAEREGALPLLQFALSRIWEGMVAGVAPAKTLEDIGGVGGALAGEAERVYQRLSLQQQTIARRIFLGLVRLGEGSRDTRRRVALTSLVSQKDSLAAVKQVLEKFSNVSVRLITCAATAAGTETAEVTHEALFDHWKRFQQWLEESRSDLRFQRRLEMAATDWDDMGRPEGKLWRSPDLDLLRQYAEHASDELTPLGMAFFTASEQAVEQAEKEQKRQRQLLTRVLLAGLSLTTGAALFATFQMQEVERQRVDQLATTAEALLLSGQPLEAALHAIAAVGASQSTFVQFLRPAPFNSAYASLLDAVRANHERNQLKGHQGGASSVAFSPDGNTLVSGGRDGTVRLWDVITGKAIREPLTGHEGLVYSVTFSPNGNILVSHGADGTVRLWDVTTGKTIGEPIIGHEYGVTSVAFSPDGNALVSGGRDGTVRLWDAKTRKALGKPLRGHEDWVASVAFSPDGNTLVSSGGDGTVRLWDATKIREAIAEPFIGHEYGVTSVAFSPDGNTLVSGSYNGTVRLWDITTRKAIAKPLKGHEGGVYSVAFSPDGSTLVSGGRDRTVIPWDIAAGKAIAKPLRGHEHWVYSVVFSPNGSTLASGSADGTLRLWDVTTGKAIGEPLRGHGNFVYSVAFSPDGSTLASGGADGTLRLWDVTTGKAIGEPLKGHDDFVYSVAFSPDGNTLVSGGADGTVRLWHISRENLLQGICNQLRWHPRLAEPTDPIGEEARQTCDRHVWSKQ